jgi:hypothetical protein
MVRKQELALAETLKQCRARMVASMLRSERALRACFKLRLPYRSGHLVESADDAIVSA